MSDTMTTIDPARSHARRIGAAPLVRAAYSGVDLTSLRDQLRTMSAEAGPAMDLAVVEQLMGERETGLRIQTEALRHQQCFRGVTAPANPRLRVLAIAAPLDIGGNTPIDFLVADPGVELTVLYLTPGAPFDGSVPDHDIAVITIPDQGEGIAVLDTLRPLIARWPRPILNAPKGIGLTDRDALPLVLASIPKLRSPVSVRMARDALRRLASDGDLPTGLHFPLIVRPSGSHAGQGLERIAAAADLDAYLSGQAADEFFVSPFVDYSSPDGLFRKYRVVFIEGEAYACHMAIADTWAVWYLNADMYASADKRREEAEFLGRFEEGFGSRHAAALRELARRLGLNYVAIDCAETRDGDLLVFEASVAMLVHDMDPPDLYPYKLPQMKRIFADFTAMLDRHAATAKLAAA